jgi:hypothetical protein
VDRNVADRRRVCVEVQVIEGPRLAQQFRDGESYLSSEAWQVLRQHGVLTQ